MLIYLLLALVFGGRIIYLKRKNVFRVYRLLVNLFGRKCANIGMLGFLGLMALSFPILLAMELLIFDHD